MSYESDFLPKHVYGCGIDSCGDGLPCNCPCHDERLEDYNLKDVYQYPYDNL